MMLGDREVSSVPNASGAGTNCVPQLAVEDAYLSSYS